MTATLTWDTRPMQTGGAGALIEVLLGIVGVGAAGLSAIAVLTPPADEAEEPEPEDDE